MTSNFKSLLQNYSITGYRLSKVSGIPQSNISAWVTNERNPLSMTIETADKIAQALNITIDQLFSELKK
jgi:transcriptional regulator with XRE-family HTH domain